MAWITDDIMAAMAAPEFLIEDILVSGTAAALVSAPGIGKTFVALDMAFAVAAGVPWHGFKTQRSSVVYILAEGLGGLRQRVLAWRLDRNIPVGVSVGVWFWDRAVQLANFPSRTEFITELRKVEPTPRFIIVDTLARCFAGRDENAAGEMGEFVAGVDLLRLSGATVLILHHEGHIRGRERGSTALRGAVDSMMYLEPGNVEGDIVLKSLKLREGELWEPIGLHLRQVELPDETTSCVVDDMPPAPADISPKWASAVRLLGEKFPEGASFKEWMAVVKLSKPSFCRMLREVKRRKLIEQDGEKYRRKESK